MLSSGCTVCEIGPLTKTGFRVGSGVGPGPGPVVWTCGFQSEPTGAMDQCLLGVYNTFLGLHPFRGDPDSSYSCMFSLWATPGPGPRLSLSGIYTKVSVPFQSDPTGPKHLLV